jgi:hypothetical protein
MALSDYIPDMQQALSELQAVTVETVKIGSTNYNCWETQSPSSDLNFEQGGSTFLNLASVAVLQSDLPIAPSRNTYITFRGVKYRVDHIDDCTTTWNIHLLPQQA